MRLVPPLSVPKALGLLNGGNALATTIAAPLGSFWVQLLAGVVLFLYCPHRDCCTYLAI